jgi:hypothetical protein
MNLLLRTIFIFSLISSCNAQQKPMIEIGDELKHLTAVHKGSFIMISSAQLEQSYNVIIDDVNYLICKDMENRIKYIETKDFSFITADSVKIGMSFKEVLKHTNNPPRLENGWAFIVSLNSGWNAAFEISKNDFNKMDFDSTVKWLFKRK